MHSSVVLNLRDNYAGHNGILKMGDQPLCRHFDAVLISNGIL